MMPDEFAFQLHRFDLAVVHLANNARVAVVGEESEFFVQIDCFHGGT
jgi:hypothetical protein